MKNLNLNYDMKNTFKLGLDLIDLCILRWFDNLVKSGNTFLKIIDDEQYYLIQYNKLINEVPVLYIKKGAIYKKLQIMTEKKILKKVLIKDLGRYNYYTFGENYSLLLPRPEPGAYDDAHNFIHSTHQDNDATHSFKYDTHENNDAAHNFNHDIHQNNDATHNFDDDHNKNAAPADEFDVEAHIISNHTEMLDKIRDEDNENTAEPAQKYLEYTPINSQALHHDEDPTYQSPKQKINNNYTRPELNGIALGLLLYQRIKWVHPKYELPDFVKWSNTIDKFLKESGVDPWEMADVIRWVCNYVNFWNYKILTPEELIARYDELSQNQKMAA